ncbi:hypothetical protein [Faecalibaculum rodentium]|jgi:hypothetical protein|uniref:hypothetical protein n=1 Tax=Faecalibaculum rodentium TaxID=1702221 RepID=UPI0025A1E7A4|nr:hypothetical protein [Faecalibaculum rodentium]
MAGRRALTVGWNCHDADDGRKGLTKEEVFQDTDGERQEPAPDGLLADIVDSINRQQAEVGKMASACFVVRKVSDLNGDWTQNQI